MKKQTRPALRTADKVAAKLENKKADNNKIEILAKQVEILTNKVDSLTKENIKLNMRLKKGFKTILQELASEKKF
jgi:hypothetical protein